MAYYHGIPCHCHGPCSMPRQLSTLSSMRHQTIVTLVTKDQQAVVLKSYYMVSRISYRSCNPFFCFLFCLSFSFLESEFCVYIHQYRYFHYMKKYDLGLTASSRGKTCSVGVSVSHSVIIPPKDSWISPLTFSKSPILRNLYFGNLSTSSFVAPSC